VMQFKNRMVQSSFDAYGNKYTTEQYNLVDEILTICHKNYSNGGDIIIETFEFEEILKEFKNLDDIKNYIEISLEQEKNCRWGEDNDPELLRSLDNWE